MDPVATARMTAEQAIARLAATPDEHVGETFVGPMRLADYLPTRVVELGLHTLDLQAATGQPLALPASATNVMLGVLAELADLPVLLLAMTGRRALPDGFNVMRLSGEAGQRARCDAWSAVLSSEPAAGMTAPRRHPPFHAMEMAGRATEREATGASVIHLEVGQPSAPAPAAVREAAKLALERDTIGYTNAPGLLSLREAIAGHYLDWYGVDVDPAHIVVTAGASAGFTLAFLACFEPGQRVGVVEPGYPCYRNTLQALGVEPVAIPVGPDTRWAPTPERGRRPRVRSTAWWWPARRTHRDRAAGRAPRRPRRLVPVATACSSCPTRSTTASPTGSGRRARLALDRGAVVVSSFSKYFCMTGWRLGWITAPPSLMAAVERFQQNLYICAPTLSQLAAVAAFGCSEELDGHVTRYAANRRLLLDGLAAAGLTDRAAADGAFYVYADVSHLAADSLELCRRWLDEAGVAATPGIDFDLVRGPPLRALLLLRPRRGHRRGLPPAGGVGGYRALKKSRMRSVASIVRVVDPNAGRSTSPSGQVCPPPSTV